MKFYIVDAFTEKIFGGNPAGVVILGEGGDFPSDEIMRKTAAELRYSETAFVRQISAKEFQIRYFTPANEVDLCGHATIGAFTALLDARLVKDDSEYVNHTLAGSLSIKIHNNFIMMEMAQAQLLHTLEREEELNRLYQVMGLSYEPVIVQSGCSSYINLLPMIVSTGLPDILMPVPSRNHLSRISPDFEALSQLSKDYDAVGVHAFTLDRKGYGITAHCRNFAPLYDIDEEAATGTSNGALTYYLYLAGLIPGGKECAFIQGEAMNRPSSILSHISVEEDTISIQVGGTGMILACGEIFI